MCSSELISKFPYFTFSSIDKEQILGCRWIEAAAVKKKKLAENPRLIDKFYFIAILQDHSIEYFLKCF